MRKSRIQIAVTSMGLCLAAGTAAAQPALPDGVALYAGGAITFDGNISILGGDVVAGGDVRHTGNILSVESIFAEGGFLADPASFQNSSGQWYFNNDIVGLGGPGSVIGGSVSSVNGNIDFLDGNQAVNGNITAGGDIEWEFVFGSVAGNVVAGGNVNVTAQVAGTTAAGQAVNLPSFSLPGLPAGRSLAPSSNDVTLNAFESIALSPGSYGDLTFASGNTVSLTSGTYVFNDIINSFPINRLAFDTSSGSIDLYVTNDLELDLIQVINGVELFGGSTPDPDEAENIFIETGGDFIGGASLYGTIFAPNGEVTLTSFSDLTGRVFAGGDVLIQSSDITVIPEPSSLALLAVGALALMRRRR